MPSLTSARSIETVRGLSNAARLNVAGLVLTAAAMLVQIAAGSTLYPSITGPIVLLLTALIVAFVPGRWPAYAGLVVPLVLGLGAIVAAAMSGGFIDQLTDVGNPGLFLGSVLHIVGIVAALAGGVGMILNRRVAGARGR
jgi:hypothetical protein